MVDEDQIYHRLSEIEEAINYLEKIDETLLKDKKELLLARYYLQIILEAMFTIGNQIIANKQFQKPVSYRHILKILHTEKIIPNDLLQNLLPLVEIRNKLVHTYWKITINDIIKLRDNNIKHFKKFVKLIINYLSKT